VDVACGTGVIARLARDEVGPSGTVTGLDLNPGMLEVARSVSPSDLGITWREGNAESIPLPDASFDVVFCGLSLQFMNKLNALREMRRVLVPEGRLLLSTPGRMPAPFGVVEEALARHIGPETAGFVKAVFSFHDPDEMKTLLSEAGLSDVKVEAITNMLPMPPPRDFMWQYIRSTPLAPAVLGADASKREAFERETIQGLERFVDRENLILEQGALVATARK
jgi:ubiquinone/menaquinone biosynthesis C-methylase UbiE